ncbi:MAG: hypothetical protein H0V47_10110 [Chloroflexia bacterium]|nr:hypothetical protein [Chloroflexia bacterium]
MATLSTVRARIRTRLEEQAAAVWSDVEIDEAITASLEEYSHLFPREESVDLPVIAGATSVDGPEDTFDVLRLTLGNGRVIPRRASPVGNSSGEELAWEWFAGTIHLSRPVEAQTLTVWGLTGRAIEQVPEADIGVIVLGAVWRALQQRGVQDFKRGGSMGGMNASDVIRSAEREYGRAMDSRRRRVRSRAMGAG